ncbi:hypothetical protein WICMUC_001612 [Wickerhamomyces mucosus]|uniref:Uncharacterized protein n=1 Tax=Wickerhamomyces mucosus TaxID=1378264 RepID=A0A9P8TG34_9ASCO|nr:hypothetical protein WICMUC_001612 [Wickerhamomyces mucosus]
MAYNSTKNDGPREVTPPPSTELKFELRSETWISSSTSANSSSTPNPFGMAKPSLANLKPKTTNKPAAKNCVSLCEIKVGKA